MIHTKRLGKYIWNVQDNLITNTDVATYLQAALEDGSDDAEFLSIVIRDAICALLRINAVKGGIIYKDKRKKK